MKLTEKPAQSMKQQLKEIEDVRKARGKRHSVATVLAIAICAMLSGNKHYNSIWEWAKRASQNMLKRLGCRYHDEKKRYILPSEPTIRRMLKSVLAEEVEKIRNEWIKKLGLKDDDSAIAVDEKVLKGANDRARKKRC
jgi:thermostable 8-oxoguanine DNA glycosylase